MANIPWWVKKGVSHPGFKKGDRNPNWTGDNITKEGVHWWVKQRKTKPELCEICGEKPPYDLSNISGEYKRDLSDWEYICRGCHMIKDGRMGNFVRAWGLGSKHTKEAKKKFSEIRKGMKHTERTKRKIREAKLKQWREGVYDNRLC